MSDCAAAAQIVEPFDRRGKGKYEHRLLILMPLATVICIRCTIDAPLCWQDPASGRPVSGPLTHRDHAAICVASEWDAGCVWPEGSRTRPQRQIPSHLGLDGRASEASGGLSCLASSAAGLLRVQHVSGPFRRARHRYLLGIRTSAPIAFVRDNLSSNGAPLPPASGLRGL